MFYLPIFAIFSFPMCIYTSSFHEKSHALRWVYCTPGYMFLFIHITIPLG
jgi:hypothetical protein